jgi:flagellar protein FliS
MTQLNAAISAYRSGSQQVHPLVGVVKLYDEVLRRIGKAIEGTEAKKFEDAYIHVSRASLILRGLAGNLRADIGGAEGAEISSILKQTYVTNMIALHTSYGKKDAPQRYRKIRSGLLELRNAWAVTAGMAELRLEGGAGRGQ